MNKKPRGYFEKILAYDTETSGLHFGGNPCREGDKYFQILSIGLIVTDVKTFTKEHDKLYIEIEWNGESEWSEQAEGVHGLSKSYLKANGKTEEEAVELIANFIIKHFGTQCVKCLGHNIHSFDIPFLDDLMKRHGIELKFGNRHVDTFAMSMGTIGAFNSDDLFDTMGLPERQQHNAMEDIEYTMKSAARIKKLWTDMIGVEAYD